MIVVYGATGRAGAGVARRLRESGHAIAVAGRDAAGVERVARTLGVPGRVAGIFDPRPLLEGASLLVNAAGPHVETARPLAEACIDAKTHYLDISFERAGVEALHSLDVPARARGVTLVSAAGAKGALGGWARALLAGRHPHVDHFDVAYAHAGSAYWCPTPGALLSFAREVSELLDRSSKEYGLSPRLFEFPPPFAPGMAVQTRGADDVSRGRVQSWLSVDPGTLSNFAWASLHAPNVVGAVQEAVVATWRTIAATPAHELARFLPPPGVGPIGVVVETDGARAGIAAPDAYSATAAIVDLCVRALANAPAGAISPADFIRPQIAFRALLQSGAIRVFTGGRNR